jgi:hypothetical protein
MSDWTKVILAAVVVTVVVHAPPASAALGSVAAGVMIWAGSRLDALRRRR